MFYFNFRKKRGREEINKEREVEAAITVFNRELTSLNVKAIIPINSKCLIIILLPRFDLHSTKPNTN